MSPYSVIGRFHDAGHMISVDILSITAITTACLILWAFTRASIQISKRMARYDIYALCRPVLGVNITFMGADILNREVQEAVYRSMVMVDTSITGSNVILTRWTSYTAHPSQTPGAVQTIPYSYQYRAVDMWSIDHWARSRPQSGSSILESRQT